jgi:hypothetical protein
MGWSIEAGTYPRKTLILAIRKNTDFGNKKVYFEVEGNKVDYADYEIIAYLIEYEKLKQAKDLWQHDWAQYGLQYGRPLHRFPTILNATG